METDTKRRRFRELHTAGTFVLPNLWDVGSALLLQHLGFPALATTSSGFAATLGRDDQHLTRDELVAHVATLTAATDVPVTVDAENGYAPTPEGVAETVELLAAAGAAGRSVEDYDPVAGRVHPVGVAVERVSAAAEACARHGMVLTGRAENHLYGVGDLDDTVARLAGVRRVSTGGALAWAPYGALVEAARELASTGTTRFTAAAPSRELRAEVFRTD
jgi:2-methylisocitrate lyase-like PEP mutase family enzyme